MDKHLRDYYSSASDGCPKGNFHKVISLNDSPDVGWEKVKACVPLLPRGWYEAAQLDVKDRIEFISAFWLKQLPFRPRLNEVVAKFFGELDDIAIFLIQQKFDDPFRAEMVYSCRGDRGFFRGHPPATDLEIAYLKSLFPDYTFPKDYRAFLRIHNGFYKSTDTGVLQTSQMEITYATLQKLLQEKEEQRTEAGEVVNPKALIAFYESFGLPCYQCFWGEWYPEDEMGNVYYSALTQTISSGKKKGSWAENLAFPTFLDWLMFYLENIEE